MKSIEKMVNAYIVLTRATQCRSTEDDILKSRIYSSVCKILGGGKTILESKGSV
jgi:hypothetical protein